MKRFLALAVAACLVLAGCASGEPELKKSEADALKNPSKEVPKEAIEAMQKMGQGPNENSNIKASPKGNY